MQINMQRICNEYVLSITVLFCLINGASTTVDNPSPNEARSTLVPGHVGMRVSITCVRESASFASTLRSRFHRLCSEALHTFDAVPPTPSLSRCCCCCMVSSSQRRNDALPRRKHQHSYITTLQSSGVVICPRIRQRRSFDLQIRLSTATQLTAPSHMPMRGRPDMRPAGRVCWWRRWKGGRWSDCLDVSATVGDCLRGKKAQCLRYLCRSPFRFRTVMLCLRRREW